MPNTIYLGDTVRKNQHVGQPETLAMEVHNLIHNTTCKALIFFPNQPSMNIGPDLLEL